MVSGCIKKEPGRYYGKGYSIKLPDNWEEVDDKPSYLGVKLDVAVMDPDKVKTITIASAPLNKNLGSDIESIGKTMSGLYSQNGIIVKEHEAINVNGLKAYWMILETSGITGILYYFKNDKQMFTTGCFSENKVFDDNFLNLCENTIEGNFRLEK